MRVGRIPYINCYPVYGAIDRGIVPLDAQLVSGVPTRLNALMAQGALDVSVVSTVEYARDWERYLLLPDLGITCDGPVRSVMLFSSMPARELTGARVVVSRSSMTSVALLELLFEHVWHARPEFVPGDAEPNDFPAADRADARLVIGDAALLLQSGDHPSSADYPHAYDLGGVWKTWTGLPFVFAVWVAQRSTDTDRAMAAHAALIKSRDWGLAHLPELARQAHVGTGVRERDCLAYLSGLDWRLSLPHLKGLSEFFRRLELAGKVPAGKLVFLGAA